LDVEKFVQEAFKRDSRIRYVGVVDNEYHVLISKMREGLQSVTDPEADRNFLQFMPLIIVDTAEKLQRVVGRLESVTMRYDSILLVFFRIKEVVILLAYSPEVTTPFISATSDLMRMLGTTYLGED
jgi:hypothetical protein